MSHSSGEVLQNGRVVGYFEYNGTADFAYPNIRATLQEVEDHWRDPDFDAACACGGKPINVELHAAYCDLRWQSQACLKCRVITGETHPYD